MSFLNRPNSRDRVYDVVDGERDYQDGGRGNALRHDGTTAPLTSGELMFLMEQCLADARAAWYRPDGLNASLNHIRKVTALGVQCMERYGAPPRE